MHRRQFAQETRRIKNLEFSGALAEKTGPANRAINHPSEICHSTENIGNLLRDNPAGSRMTVHRNEMTFCQNARGCQNLWSGGARHRPGFGLTGLLRRCCLILAALTLSLTQGFAKLHARDTETGAAPEIPVSALEVRAAYYISFREDIDLVNNMTLSSAADTRLAHERLAAHDPELLASGWVAYAALIAADTPAFSQAIEDQLSKKKRATVFLKEFSANPSMVLSLPGAAEAIEAVLRSAGNDARMIDAVGEDVLKNARSLYQESWAKDKISDGTSRVEEAAGFARSRVVGSPPVFTPIRKKKGVVSPNLAAAPPSWTPDWPSSSLIRPRATEGLLSQSAARRPDGGEGPQEPGQQEVTASPVATRALVLAAKYATGKLTPGLVDAYAKGRNSSRCVRMAQLNFAQCIAATRTPYEETFCIGKHGMKEMSSCIGGIADHGS